MINYETIFRSLLFSSWWTFWFHWWPTPFQGFKKMRIRNGSTLEHLFGCITTMIIMPSQYLSTFFLLFTQWWDFAVGFFNITAQERREKLRISKTSQEDSRKWKTIKISDNLSLISKDNMKLLLFTFENIYKLNSNSVRVEF